MGDFNHGHIQWKSLESTGGEDQQFIFLIQDSFLTQLPYSARTNQGSKCIRYSFIITKRINGQCKKCKPLGNSDHNPIHFDINVKSKSKKKNEEYKIDWGGGVLY